MQRVFVFGDLCSHSPAGVVIYCVDSLARPSLRMIHWVGGLFVYLSSLITTTKQRVYYILSLPRQVHEPGNMRDHPGYPQLIAGAVQPMKELCLQDCKIPTANKMPMCNSLILICLSDSQLPIKFPRFPDCV